MISKFTKEFPYNWCRRTPRVSSTYLWKATARDEARRQVRDLNFAHKPPLATAATTTIHLRPSTSRRPSFHLERRLSRKLQMAAKLVNPSLSHQTHSNKACPLQGNQSTRLSRAMGRFLPTTCRLSNCDQCALSRMVQKLIATQRPI